MTSFLFKDDGPNITYSLILDPNGDIHWVTFDDSDLNSTETFAREVQPGEIH